MQNMKPLNENELNFIREACKDAETQRLLTEMVEIMEHAEQFRREIEKLDRRK